MEYSALIVAAGQGRRMNLGYNKVFYTFADGKNVLEKTMSIFEADPRCRQIVIVTQREDYFRCMRNRTQRGNVVFVEGGATRQESVFNGLMAVSEDYVLIHDGARPFLEQACLDRLCQCLSEHDACLLTVPCKDTIKVIEEGRIKETPNRSQLVQAQTKPPSLQYFLFANRLKIGFPVYIFLGNPNPNLRVSRHKHRNNHQKQSRPHHN